MVPIPRDIPLPLPAPSPFLEALLTLAFVCHLLFVNLMVGGTLVSLGFELRGRRELARALSSAVTVNKSLAVVLGVAPLLAMNVLYTVQFYTANALTGCAWIALVPIIATAFLLLYIHKYTWERWAAHPRRHAAVLAGAAVLLMFVPLVFLANVTLMMLPERWTAVSGFTSTLLLPGLLPRYVHFVNASLTAASLFGIAFLDRRPTAGIDARHARRALYTIALVASLLQFAAGPVILATLPARGLTARSVTPIVCGAVFAVPALWLMWRERRAQIASRRAFYAICALLAATVLCMAIGRHTHRMQMLAPHRAAVERATRDWEAAAEIARRDAREAAAGVNPGKRLFDETCAGCHGIDQRVVGPPLVEIAGIYGGNPTGIVRWATAPGKKRAGYPQMPPFASLGAEKLAKIASYMLEAGTKARAPGSTSIAPR